MSESLTLQRLRVHFPESIVDVHSRLGEDTVTITRPSILAVCRYLKEEPELEYNVLMDVTAVDFWKRRPRFEVVYHLLSLRNRFRLRVKVPVGEPDPELDSVTSLWVSADWYEREVYDMFGIRFRGHPDLRRILMYPEFEGHPLRKDYPYNKRQPLVGPKD